MVVLFSYLLIRFQYRGSIPQCLCEFKDIESMLESGVIHWKDLLQKSRVIPFFRFLDLNFRIPTPDILFQQRISGPKYQHRPLSPNWQIRSISTGPGFENLIQQSQQFPMRNTDLEKILLRCYLREASCCIRNK